MMLTLPSFQGYARRGTRNPGGWSGANDCASLRPVSWVPGRARPGMTAVIAALLAMLIFVASSALAAPSFPKLTGRVVDQAQILSPQAEAALTQKLEALETQTGRQFVVVTLRDLQGYEIADYGYQLGRAWGIGDKERDDGALLIVAPSERKVRIEVGYGLEGVLTDALSNVILQERVLPKFRA